MKTAGFLYALIVGLSGTIGAGTVLAADTTKGATGPTRADEPLAKQFSLIKAAEFLDAVNTTWTTQRECGSCHTNYPYLMGRSAINHAGPSFKQVRDFFEDRAAHWDTNKPR
jgi:squalene-hopene/tetraprenyl-beta-curcumene cyclase